MMANVSFKVWQIFPDNERVTGNVTRLLNYFFLYLAISNKENEPKNVPNLPKLAQHFAKYKINCQKFAKDFIFLQKWQNFAKSGHTD